MFKIQFLSHGEQSVSITKTTCIMLSMEIHYIYCQNHTKRINTLKVHCFFMLQQVVHTDTTELYSCSTLAAFECSD